MNQRHKLIDANIFRKSIKSGLFHMENNFPSIWICFMKLQGWMQEGQKSDSPGQVLLCVIREGIEIAMQC